VDVAVEVVSDAGEAAAPITQIWRAERRRSASVAAYWSLTAKASALWIYSVCNKMEEENSPLVERAVNAVAAAEEAEAAVTAEPTPPRETPTRIKKKMDHLQRPTLSTVLINI
jgi:hypothetical protein